MTAPSLVLSWSISQLVTTMSGVCPFPLGYSFLKYIVIYLFGTYGADGAAAREPGTIYGTHAAFSYALNRGAMHCAAG